MKPVSLIALCLMLLLAAMPADARRRKKKATPPPPAATEVWPEEIPDYAPPAPAKPDSLPVLTDEQWIEQLMSQPIMGEPEIDAATLHRFVTVQNPDFDREIAEAYISVGRRYGIRGDIALCQSILETGWFKFADGTAVRAEQHNYCGLGVVRLGQTGHSFDTVEKGVTAQIQHLFAYACKSPLPEGEELLDPRFKLVNRGVAPTWQELSGRWAANTRYARSIMKLYVQLKRFSSDPDAQQLQAQPQKPEAQQASEQPRKKRRKSSQKKLSSL